MQHRRCECDCVCVGVHLWKWKNVCCGARTCTAGSREVGWSWERGRPPEGKRKKPPPRTWLTLVWLCSSLLCLKAWDYNFLHFLLQTVTILIWGCTNYATELCYFGLSPRKVDSCVGHMVLESTDNYLEYDIKSCRTHWQLPVNELYIGATATGIPALPVTIVQTIDLC